jgi:hypothetical protein
MFKFPLPKVFSLAAIIQSFAAIDQGNFVASIVDKMELDKRSLLHFYCRGLFSRNEKYGFRSTNLKDIAFSRISHFLPA